MACRKEARGKYLRLAAALLHLLHQAAQEDVRQGGVVMAQGGQGPRSHGAVLRVALADEGPEAVGQHREQGWVWMVNGGKGPRQVRQTLSRELARPEGRGAGE